MFARLKYLLFIPLFFVGMSSLFAQDENYFMHKKHFFLCSFKKECSVCESCTKEVYKVKILNNADKKIKSVYYTFYSPLLQKDVTREAVIEGDAIEASQQGILFLCMVNGVHWAITKIVYTDETSVSFLVDGPIRKYHQEPDECDCNVPKTLYPYGKPADKKPVTIY